MINFLNTIANIYLIGCPILTTLLIMFLKIMGWGDITYTKREGETKLSIAKEIIVMLYTGWWKILKAFIQSE
jgi:hypothetical protein